MSGFTSQRNPAQTKAGDPASDDKGNTGFTGATGAPGQQGKNPAGSRDNSASFSEFKAKLAADGQKIIVGATGGTGLTPQNPADEKNLDLGSTLSGVRTTFASKTIAEKLKTMETVWQKLQPVFINALSQSAMGAITMGEMGNVLKAEVVQMQGHGNWLDFAKKNIPFMDIRTLQDHMKIARVRGVQKHSHFGIDKLNKLASLVDSSMSMDDDPIQTILDRIGEVSPMTPLEDFRILSDTAILLHRLGRKKLVVAKDLARDFVAAGYELSSKDIEEMMARQDQDLDPGEFLTAVMANNGSREGLLTNVIPKSAVKTTVISDEAETSEIPDLNSELQKMRENLALARTQDTQVAPIADELIDGLIADLNALKARKATKAAA